MSTPSQPDWMLQAQQQGLLPPGAGLPKTDRPWPVKLLTALGAWLAVIPFLIFLALLLGRAWEHGPTAYVTGLVLLAASVGLLRAGSAGRFLEQLALPLLMLGLGSLGYALGRDLPHRAAPALGLLICAGLVLALPRHWLRLILGMAGAWLCMALVQGPHWVASDLAPLWWSVYLSLGLWGLAQAWLHAQGLRASGAASAALAEPVIQGWGLGLLPVLVWLSGPTFLMGGALGSGLARELHAVFGAHLWASGRMGPATLSVLAAVLGLLALPRAWPALRQLRLLLPGLLLAALAFVLPALGACLLILSLALVRGRRVLALSAAGVALWVLGSFYYRLDVPLADKALILAASGAALGAWLWLTTGRRPRPAGFEMPSGAARWTIPLCGLLSLGLVNALVWQKEQLIAQGRPVFVKLAPVDPRSLIQGDYMRLNFALPTLPPVAELAGPWRARPRLEAQLDARGVLTEVRLLAPQEAPAAGSQLLALSPVNGQWTLVSDAWYFQEGQEPLFRAAAYGEFRVLPDGRALLVGLADRNLRRLP
ncbi:GDYXXLXY domain-containing protein [Mitsuaria sp. WAJ17]|uniref:GDYXXLXY domain-containing protein n=1 Tax=Mitsuaria sp. WAJ17 TaxID=2761452 RepID=UPI001603FBAF|nr:GDYXXLXY domain-containing protein [Mitsuaria sp. WAJ17]MBB2487600.1 GDYXXLXY domain-containing protein [Mitsuaria sp. WAJ17]